MARNAIPATPTMIWVRWSSCFCSGVLSASVWFSNVAMLPISVLIPVPVTIISPRPRVTEVFMNARHSRSPRPTSSPSIGATSLSTGALSPGEGRFLDLQGGRHDQPTVGRHAVARLEEDDVARHQLRGIDLDRGAVAPHPGDVLQHLLQGRQARLGLRLLPQAEDRVEHRQADEDDGGARFAGDHLVHDRGTDEDDLHQVLVLAQEGRDGRLRLLGREDVRAVLLPPLLHLRVGEPPRRIHVEAGPPPWRCTRAPSAGRSAARSSPRPARSAGASARSLRTGRAGT